MGGEFFSCRGRGGASLEAREGETPPATVIVVVEEEEEEEDVCLTGAAPACVSLAEEKVSALAMISSVYALPPGTAKERELSPPRALSAGIHSKDPAVPALSQALAESDKEPLTPLPPSPPKERLALNLGVDSL